MAWLVPLLLVSVAVLLLWLRSARAVQKAARRAATVGPVVLVHDINDDRCTGCDACVAVCPTNVLDLVNNKSRVLRFEDCIQCEACMWACPTEALVMFPENTEPPPLLVPEVDEQYQTAVPGQYLIGEVAGKPLVKNAANLGRAVVEHMVAKGLKAGRLPGGVDVLIVGSGPAGLSAALTCIQRGLSYLILEKEQIIASTIARYPKGKLVMAEPADIPNLSLLPIFDSSKEQLLPIWTDLIARVGLTARLGESVEVIQKTDVGFQIQTNIGAYSAQRVVLAIGTRGKPRTLGVPGEHLPKVASLLDDPAEWMGRDVLVVGGGDSAVEAAMALADAGARVSLSYRGTALNRCAPKNKQSIEAYAAEARLKVYLGSKITEFTEASAQLLQADGSTIELRNQGAFVLIGSDPPIPWLEKLGVHFVERPHQYVMAASDELVMRFLSNAGVCSEDAAGAAAAVKSVPQVATGRTRAGTLNGARRLMRAATNMLGGERKGERDQLVQRLRDGKRPARPLTVGQFARAATADPVGKRDDLSSNERTRLLRMLRDEGGRIADEDSQVDIGIAPRQSRRATPTPIPGGARGGKSAVAMFQRSGTPPVFRTPPAPSKPPPLPQKARAAVSAEADAPTAIGTEMRDDPKKR